MGQLVARLKLRVTAAATTTCVCGVKTQIMAGPNAAVRLS
jgi:hypothetical protein